MIVGYYIKQLITRAWLQKQQRAWQTPKDQRMLQLRNQPMCEGNHPKPCNKKVPKSRPTKRSLWLQQCQSHQTEAWTQTTNTQTHAPRVLSEPPRQLQQSWADSARTSAEGTEMQKRSEEVSTIWLLLQIALLHHQVVPATSTRVRQRGR